MDQHDFELKFQEWNEEWNVLPWKGESIEKDIGQYQLDVKLITLANLYLEANAEQRYFIREYFQGKDDLLWYLIGVIQHVAKLIKSKEDVEWLRTGLIIAAIQSGRIDYRDLIVSLVILRYEAERVGINYVHFFDEAIKIASPEMEPIFRNARDHAPKDVEFTVNMTQKGEYSKIDFLSRRKKITDNKLYISLFVGIFTSLIVFIFTLNISRAITIFVFFTIIIYTIFSLATFVDKIILHFEIFLKKFLKKTGK